MTTHILIVDSNTFKYHLEYMFAGTGAKNYNIKFLSSGSTINSTVERLLVGMYADCARMREGDNIIFYLQSDNGNEGKFYGVFKCKTDPFLDYYGTFLESQLNKCLTYRICLEPKDVYPEGVTEWEALDEIKSITSPNQMLWSLIYRKLKGNRGNTMITIYEAERLIDLIRQKNRALGKSPIVGNDFTFNHISRTIDRGTNHYTYTGTKSPMQIIKRLILKYQHTPNIAAHEVHLQAYITQNIGKGTNPYLDNKLGITRSNLEWIGNEVSCGVGMQSIDVMLSKVISDDQREIIPIELKDEEARPGITRQITRYIDWIEQYYKPNRISDIQPVLICRKTQKGLDPAVNSEISVFNRNSRGRYNNLIYIEYEVDNRGNLIFK